MTVMNREQLEQGATTSPSRIAWREKEVSEREVVTFGGKCTMHRQENGVRKTHVGVKGENITAGAGVGVRADVMVIVHLLQLHLVVVHSFLRCGELSGREGMSFPMLSALYSLLSLQTIGSAQPSNRIGNDSFTSCPSMQTPHAEAVNGALEH